MVKMTDTLCWDATYATASALRDRYPDVELEEVSIELIYKLVMDLPNFEDDAELVTDAILLDIYREWYELMHG
jgi:FeS assembly protein IscX